MNDFTDIDSTQIGMNLWFEPQISEHWPKLMFGRRGFIMIWLIRPGIASIFSAIVGIDHEWITSHDVTISWQGVWVGRIIRLSTSKRRNCEDLLVVSVVINESKEVLKFGYSYDQYH